MFSIKKLVLHEKQLPCHFRIQVISNQWGSSQEGARIQEPGGRVILACAGIGYTLVSVRAWRRYSKSPGPGAKILQNLLLGPLGDCCANTGTIETEEVVALRPITPQEAKPPGSWILAPGSLLITDCPWNY